MRRSVADAPVQRWAVPTPKLDAPLRKEVERETGDPEGNLVIVERVAHERQRLFSCREYGWVGSAHVLNSTRYGTLASTARHFPQIRKHCIRLSSHTRPADSDNDVNPLSR